MPVYNQVENNLFSKNILFLFRVVKVTRSMFQQPATFTQALCLTLLRKQIFATLLRKYTIYAWYFQWQNQQNYLIVSLQNEETSDLFEDYYSSWPMDCSLITEKLMAACQEALQDLKSNSSYGFDFENIKVPQEIEKLTIKYAKY